MKHPILDTVAAAVGYTCIYLLQGLAIGALFMGAKKFVESFGREPRLMRDSLDELDLLHADSVQIARALNKEKKR